MILCLIWLLSLRADDKLLDTTKDVVTCVGDRSNIQFMRNIAEE